MARLKKDTVKVFIKPVTKKWLAIMAEKEFNTMSGIAAEMLDKAAKDYWDSNSSPSSAPNKPTIVTPKTTTSADPIEPPDMIDLPGGFTYYPNTRQCRHDTTNDGWTDITLEQAKKLVEADIQENGVYVDND